MTGGGPLAGWRVLVPRSADRSAPLVEAFAAAGAEAVPVELISVAPPLDLGEFDRQLTALAAGGFGWVGFTSVNAVDAVLQRAAALGLEPVVVAGTGVAAVGPATAAAVRAAGLPVDLVPAGRGSGAALASAWPRAGIDGSVLLPRSDLAAVDLPDALRLKGFRVVTVIAYRTVSCDVPTEVADELTAGRFNAVVYTSPSTVAALDGIRLADSTVNVAIGTPSAAAVTARGLTVDAVADTPTPAGLVEALSAVARTRRLQET